MTPQPQIQRLTDIVHILHLPAPIQAQGKMLCFHGGGGVGGTPDMLLPFGQRVATVCALTISLARYRTLDQHGPECTLTDMIDDALLAFDVLRDDHTQRPFLFGASFGGLLALEVARQRPGHVAGLVLMNPVSDTTHTGYQNKVLTPARCGHLSPSLTYPALINATLNDASAPPCLIAHGCADEVVPIDQSRRFAALWPKERCRMIEVEGAGHGFFNRQPHDTRMAEQINAFVAERIATGGNH